MYTIKLLFVAVLFGLACASPYNFFSKATFNDPKCSNAGNAMKEVHILDVCFPFLTTNHMYYSMNGSVVLSYMCQDSACKQCNSLEQFTIGECYQYNAGYVFNNVSMGAFPPAAKQDVSVFYATQTCTNSTGDITNMYISGGCASMYSCTQTVRGAMQQWCGAPDFLA